MEYALTILEAILLIVILVMLWQVWQKIKQVSKNEDDLIGKEWTKELTTRLNVMVVCFAIEIILLIAKFVLRYFV